MPIKGFRRSIRHIGTRSHKAKNLHKNLNQRSEVYCATGFVAAHSTKGGIFVPKKLNDSQIAELIMKHTNGTSISALAKEYRIDWTTCKRYIDNARDLQEKCNTIKKG